MPLNSPYSKGKSLCRSEMKDGQQQNIGYSGVHSMLLVAVLGVASPNACSQSQLLPAGQVQAQWGGPPK